MRLRPSIIWIPLAIARALAVASMALPAYAQGFGDAPHPAPYRWHGPGLYHGYHGNGSTFGPFSGQSCYADTLNGRVCVD